MYGTYLLHCYSYITREISRLDIYASGGAEFHPKRKKLKGYQKK